MFRTLRQYFHQFCWPIFLAMVVLLVIGISAIRMADRAGGGGGGHMPKQIIFTVVGVTAFFVVTLVPCEAATDGFPLGLSDSSRPNWPSSASLSCWRGTCNIAAASAGWAG